MAPLDVLQRTDATLSQLTGAVTALEKAGLPRSVKIGVSSSVTVDLLGIYLRKHGLLAGSRIEYQAGNYDDPIGDVDLFQRAGVDMMVLLPFFDNLLPSFEAQASSLAPGAIDAKEQELRARYRLAFEKAQGFKNVFVGSLHRLSRAADAGGEDAVGHILARFNAALREVAGGFANVRMIDMESIVSTVGEGAAFDARFYFRSKAPYSGAFMNELARRIALATRGFGSYFYKVLALDCDNTLWGGVIGEDLLGGIKLGPYDYPGNIYWRVQQEFAALEREGVLLCLCTKNNPQDLQEVLDSHPDMVLRDRHIVLKKANWEDKPSSLRAIAAELNVGLDSIVFVDDSSFECEAVRMQLPTVKVVQVPAALAEYPRVVAGIRELFLAGGISADSRGKTEQYRQRAGAEELRAQFDSQDAYLASLELRVELTRNAVASLARIAELSQKSNQFNLTTQRYSPADITQMMQGESHAVYSVVVGDKFGNAGLTGVIVMRYQGEEAKVENFYMSCRVIGRGVEFAIWPRILADAAARGCRILTAEFNPSAKNAQVADFYDRMGLPLVSETPEGMRRYATEIAAFAAPDNPWIEMTYVE